MVRVTRSKRRAPSGDVGAFGTDGPRALASTDAPAYLSPAARKEWESLIAACNEPDKPPRFLITDSATLASYCFHCANFAHASRQLRRGLVVKVEDGTRRNDYFNIAKESAQQMRLLAVELGLTPASRPRVHRPRETTPAVAQGASAAGAQGVATAAQAAPPAPPPGSRLGRLKIVG
jgi:P27 family predicted phage terminase small subunit